MRVAGVVFAKDGTLFDFHATWGAWTRWFMLDLARGDRIQARRLGHAVGYDMDQRRFESSSPVIAGTPGEIAAALLEHLPGAHPQALMSRINISLGEAPLVPAVPLAPLLGALRADGLKLGVSTNDGETTARTHLAKSGIADLFDFIAGFDSGFGIKPDAGALLTFAKKMQIAPEQVLVVGDSRQDLIAGRDAGMRTIGVLTGLTRKEDLAPLASAVLPDIGALPGWIASPVLEVSAA